MELIYNSEKYFLNSSWLPQRQVLIRLSDLISFDEEIKFLTSSYSIPSLFSANNNILLKGALEYTILHPNSSFLTNEIKECFFETLNDQCYGKLHIRQNGNMELLELMSKDFNLSISTLFKLAGATIARIIILDNGQNAKRFVSNNLNLYSSISRLVISS